MLFLGLGGLRAGHGKAGQMPQSQRTITRTVILILLSMVFGVEGIYLVEYGSGAHDWLYII